MTDRSGSLTLADALRLAINVLNDCAESRKLPSGLQIDQKEADLNAEAAEVLNASLTALREHE